MMLITREAKTFEVGFWFFDFFFFNGMKEVRVKKKNLQKHAEACFLSTHGNFTANQYVLAALICLVLMSLSVLHLTL